jgi:uncharacterized protein YprB with RNaseH-like and TPR domain
MLEKTFVHVNGIGQQTERRLWERGADCWDTFLERPTEFKLSQLPLSRVLETVTQSRAALDRGDFRYFSSLVPNREHWRALPSFPDRVAYLDIETDGGRGADSVTVIGLYDGKQMRQFVRGENLLDFPEALDDVALLVTFFGGGFDIPVLKQAFPRLRFDQLHLDLCPTLRRLGLGGGLKKIEKQLGLSRGEETVGLGGWDAVRLWREWRWGRESSLQTLLAYNREDVVNMVPLAEFAYRELARKTLGEDKPLSPSPVVE